MCNIAVAPLVGAWIEIRNGMECQLQGSVAPLVGALIEMSDNSPLSELDEVAPLVGAWIEIFAAREKSEWHGSLLSWERGLK